MKFTIILFVFTCIVFADENVSLRIYDTLETGVVSYQCVGDGEQLFVFVNGVPVTASIYLPLANELVDSINATVLLVDLVGTAGSRLFGDSYSWQTQRQLLEEFLMKQKPHTLLVHDAAGPVLLPLVGSIETIEELIILNTVIRPTELEPPFPLNFMQRTALAQPFSHFTTRSYYKRKIRDHGIDRDSSVSELFLNTLYREVKSDRGLPYLTKIMRGFELNENSDQLIAEGIQSSVPKLVIWAEADPVLGDMITYLEPLLEEDDTLIVKIPQAKHFFMLDYGTEIVEAIMVWER